MIQAIGSGGKSSPGACGRNPLVEKRNGFGRKEVGERLGRTLALTRS
jgi:hypothetical protein